MMYAWRIRDTVEGRDWLSLSASEAAHFESIDGAAVTLVSWSELATPSGESGVRSEAEIGEKLKQVTAHEPYEAGFEVALQWVLKEETGSATIPGSNND